MALPSQAAASQVEWVLLPDPAQQEETDVECICFGGDVPGVLSYHLCECIALGLLFVYAMLTLNLVPGLFLISITLRLETGPLFVMMFVWVTITAFLSLYVTPRSDYVWKYFEWGRFRRVALAVATAIMALFLTTYMVMWPEMWGLEGAIVEEFGATEPPKPTSTPLGLLAWMGRPSWGPYGSETGDFEMKTHTYLEAIDTGREGWPGCGREGNRPDKLDLDVYFPKRSGDELAPIIFFIHGGGWAFGDKRGFTWSLAYFLDRGYAVVSSQYSFVCEGFTISEMLDQLTVSFDLVYKNAPEWGLDRERIFFKGLSAGGHLALMLANTLNSPTCGNWESCGVKGVFNFYGVTTEAYPMKFGVETLLALTGEANKEAAKAWFPAYIVNASSPPVMSIHGTHDDVVPYTDAVLLHQNLDKAGVKQLLITAKTFGHICEMGSYGNPCAQVHRFAFERFLAL